MPTNYIVLQRNGNTSLKQLGIQEANGPNQAIKAIVNGAEGIYIAVPVRNWSEARGAPKTSEPQFVITEIDDPFDLGEQITIEEIAAEALNDDRVKAERTMAP